MLRTRRKLFIKWTTEGIVKGISFRVFYDAQACVSCREYVSISLRVWADHKGGTAVYYYCITVLEHYYISMIMFKDFLFTLNEPVII